MPCTIGWVGRQRLYDFRDDFTPDADPNWTDYGVNGNAFDPTRYLTVDSGLLILDGVTGAGYKVRNVPGLTEVRVGHRVSTGTANNGSALGIVASSQPLPAGLNAIANTSVHVAVSATGRQAAYFDGAQSPAVDTDTFTLSNGNLYETKLVMDPDAGTLTITDADGGSEVLPTGWQGLWGDTLFVECLNADLAHRLAQIEYVIAIGDDTVQLPSPNKISRNGRTLRLGGEFMVDERRGRILAAQLNGYGPHNSAEPIVEFTYDTSDGDVDIAGDLDGFYVVADIGVDYQKLAAGWFAWTAELVALPSGRSPLFEIASLGTLRDTGLAVTGDPWVAFPAGPFTIDGGVSPTNERVYGPDQMPIVIAASTADDQLYDGAITYRADLGDYRIGACAIEATFDDGNTWHPVPGDQLPAESTAWRMTNHRCRVSLVADGVTGAAKVEVFDDIGDRWEAQLFHVYNDILPFAFADVVAITVLDHSLTLVSVRVTTGGLSTIDFTLRRGAHFVECVATSGDGATEAWSVAPSPTEAADPVTGGSDADVADADGNKWAIRSPLAVDVDTATGQTGPTTDAAVFPFALSASNADLIAGVTLNEAYFAANYPEQNVVAG